MERIEIPATTYWKSKQGKKFNNEADCEKYEKLFDKWQRPSVYREIENVEGQLCHVFWIESNEELDEVIWLVHHKYNTSTCNYVSQDNRELTPQWIIAYPDYNEYNAEMAIRTLEDVRDITEDILKAAQATISTIVKLLWEKV